MALYDQLTGLANRRHLEISAAAVFARSKRHKNTFCLALVDIDHFKQFNDNYGHDEGDRILKRVADVFQRHIRESDLAIRYGGEEFLLLLSDSELEEALSFADRLRYVLADETGVTVSIGVAAYCGQDSFDEVIKSADEALYSAKRNGRNRVEYFKPDKSLTELKLS